MTIVETKTLYVRNKRLWERARKLAGRHGLSSLVERALQQFLDQQEPLVGSSNQKFVLPVDTGNNTGGDLDQNIEFQGQLVVDSRGFSVEQLPRVRVYRTAKNRLVVYRTWPSIFKLSPSYFVYPDLESLVSDRRALETSWITEDDKSGENADVTNDLVRSIRKALVRPVTRVIDDIESAHLNLGETRSVRLGRDDDNLRRAFQGKADQDVLIVALYLLQASKTDPKHLSGIYKTFARLKPVSRLGNAAGSLKDLPANVRGYLNHDTLKRSPSYRLFIHPKRGFWGLTNIGEQRATEVLHQIGLDRG